jgi:GMP synthase-like glutamine amidotransferase
MRSVAIFRFSPGDEPGRFAHWLDAHGVPWRLIALHEGEVVPADARAFAGIGTMGGPMSVNDALPWVAPMEALMRDAVAAGVPVIGHCLGGQLLAKALGAKVGTATFEWHYEAFELPPGAQRVLTNAFNENQGYVIDGRHVGFQGHVEMTAEIARGWIANSPDELPASSDASMQSAADILANLDARVAALNAVADAIYSRWATNLWH